MSVIYIHQYFLTPSEGGAVRSYHLAKGLVDAGIEVEMVTTHNSLTYDIKRVDGITVHYLPVRYENEFGFFRRGYAFLKFVRLAKKLLRKLPRPDYLYISSTPLTTGMIGLWAKRALAVPYFFEARDLWPEAPIQMGVVKSRWLKKLLYGFERRVYNEAIHLIALSPGIREGMARSCPGKPITLIPNFSDTDFFTPCAAEQTELTLTEKHTPITISYIGAIGPVNGLESFLCLAQESMKRGKGWKFILMGKGSAKQKLQTIQQEKELDNVQFLPFGDKRAVRALLADSDFAYLSFRPLPILETSSPNKFFDALAMGKPIIMNYGGWVYELVKENNIGIRHHENDYDRLIAWVEEVASNPILKAEITKTCRQLAEGTFSKHMAIRTLKECIFPFKGKDYNTSHGDASGIGA